MRIVIMSGLFLVCAVVLLTNGCVSEQQYKDLKIQNESQSRMIDELTSQAQATALELDQLKRKLDGAEGLCDIETDALNKKIAALEQDLNNKRNLIAKMQKQLLGGVQLPVELNTMLEDFAKSEEMVTYDSSRGIVKFKSDLLFEKGSDRVAPEAERAVKSLCGILNSEQAKEFDIIVAGHTDDIPILKPDTRAKHPTNWYLSAHRAISVLDIMTASNISPERVSVRGFGEYRPIAPNEPNKKGNPQNRRVEIYIVPKGI